MQLRYSQNFHFCAMAAALVYWTQILKCIIFTNTRRNTDKTIVISYFCLWAVAPVYWTQILPCTCFAAHFKHLKSFPQIQGQEKMQTQVNIGKMWTFMVLNNLSGGELFQGGTFSVVSIFQGRINDNWPLLTVRWPGGKILDNYPHCNLFVCLSSYIPSG